MGKKRRRPAVAMTAGAGPVVVDVGRLRAQSLRAASVASGEVTAAQERLSRAVAAARGAGASWVEIGEALGVSRQAARQRFAAAVGGAG